MLGLEPFATVGRIIKYWFHTNKNKTFGLSDFLILRGALSKEQLERLEQVCSPAKGEVIRSEIVDERFVFPLDEDAWSDILSIDAVASIIENFSPAPQPGHFMRNRIVKISSDIGSGGGWHRDSFQPQIKIFIPMSDATRMDGALQYVRGSSSNWSKLIHSMHGRRRNRDYDAKEIEVLSMKRGDLAVVNTSGVHRGGPPARVGRDMITVYMNETFK